MLPLRQVRLHPLYQDPRGRGGTICVQTTHLGSDVGSDVAHSFTFPSIEYVPTGLYASFLPPGSG